MLFSIKSTIKATSLSNLPRDMFSPSVESYVSPGEYDNITSFSILQNQSHYLSRGKNCILISPTIIIDTNNN